MNNYIWWILSFPFYLVAQNFYIKPVHFLDYSILIHHNQFWLYIYELNDEKYHYYAYQNDILVPISNPLKLSNDDINQLRIVVYNSDSQTINYFSFQFDPQFLITDSFQVYQSYLLHGKNYSTEVGFKEIKIYKQPYRSPLPPHWFYKNKSKFEYVEKTCNLDFNKIKPNDLISLHSYEDSIFIPVFNSYYPHLKLSDSLEAMVYLLTKGEFRFLKKVNKKSYLNFVWSGFDEERKIGLKELYFQRVYEANLYFHENVEGWRTERGMIYIIFGKPSAIVIYNGYEDWFYERTQLNDKPVFFRFKVQQKKGMKTEYILERKTEYYDIWNDAIDAWRNGLILKEK